MSLGVAVAPLACSAACPGSRLGGVGTARRGADRFRDWSGRCGGRAERR
jgi:hypothetical protein